MNVHLDHKKVFTSGPAVMDSNAGKNLHVRIREKILRDIIASGAQAGERFCTETELALRMNVCRNTVRKAMSDLEREGYINRRRRVGTIIGSKISIHGTSEPQNLVQTTSSGIQRQRMIVTLPRWDDSTEGFFAGRLLRHLIAPEFTPPLSVEIRHANDQLDPTLRQDIIILAIDPQPEMILQLKQLADQGMRIIVAVPSRILPGMINICSDSRRAVSDAVKNLYALGHKAVGIINHIQNHYDYRQYMAGYLDAHRELNLPILPNAFVQLIDGDNMATPDVVNITAWVCTFFDAVKLVKQECMKHDLAIPHDISVVCMDDPMDEGIKNLGVRLSVVRLNSVATAAVIQSCIQNWQKTFAQDPIVVPMEQINRETITSPPNQFHTI